MESTPSVGELVKFEVDPRYTRDSLTFTFVTDPATPTNVLGRIVTATGAEVAAAGVANARGVVIETGLVEDGAGVNVLVRGPALVNKGLLKFTDSAGGVMVQATVIAALLANGIRVVDEPTVFTEQTS